MAAKLNDLKGISPSGTISLTPTNPPKPPGKYVFQRVRAGLGNVVGTPSRRLQLRRHVIPYDPRTVQQRRQRLHMKNAVAAYHAANAAQRAQYHADAIVMQVTNFNAYVSQWMKKNPLPTGAQWNGGAVTWNNGAAYWNL